MHEKNAKIVSLVPSWTETLLEAGIAVAGRTRFCIHPREKVSGIPVLGGTKTAKAEEILALKPDFVILDKEENKKELAEALTAAGVKIVVSHVSSLTSAAHFLDELSALLKSQELSGFAARYRRIPENISRVKFFQSAVLKESGPLEFQNLDYVIWKNPYMVIGKETFIADVFARAGIQLIRSEKYPQVSENELKTKYCLFSSEPYPFAREFDKLTAEGFRGALVDGEKISWYGVRNLLFLEACSE